MINLVGHTLDKAEYNETEQTLSLTLDGDKVFLVKVEGDCCSTGKFLDVRPAYSPSKIMKQTDRTESFQDGEYTVYETVLELENGERLIINYDNKSNGYYGSSLEMYYKYALIWNFPIGKEPS